MNYPINKLPTCIALDFTLRQNTQECGITNPKMAAVANAIRNAYEKALYEQGLDGATTTTLSSMKPKPFARWFTRAYKRAPQGQGTTAANSNEGRVRP